MTKQTARSSKTSVIFDGIRALHFVLIYLKKHSYCSHPHQPQIKITIQASSLFPALVENFHTISHWKVVDKIWWTEQLLTLEWLPTVKTQQLLSTVMYWNSLHFVSIQKALQHIHTLMFSSFFSIHRAKKNCNYFI